MPEMTIGRMAKLYGLHRSTLYEAVGKGRVSAGFNAKGQRVIDLSEMIRAYGEPPSNTQHPTPLPDTQPDSAQTALIDELRRQTAVIEKMSERIERLEATMLALPSPSSVQAPDSAPSPKQGIQDDACESETPRKPISSFGDLLSRMEMRNPPH